MVAKMQVNSNQSYKELLKGSVLSIQPQRPQGPYAQGTWSQIEKYI